MPTCFLASSHIRQIRTDPLKAQHHRIITKIILGHREPRSPITRKIRPELTVSYLLAVALHAPFGPIALRSFPRKSGTSRGVKLASLDQIRRLLLADLSLRNEYEHPKRERQRGQNP